MTSYTDAVNELIKFIGAMSVLSGVMAWYKNTTNDDKTVVEAANLVLDSLSDADKVSKTDMHTGKNLRDQISVSEAQELHRERELRGFGVRRN